MERDPRSGPGSDSGGANQPKDLFATRKPRLCSQPGRLQRRRSAREPGRARYVLSLRDADREGGGECVAGARRIDRPQVEIRKPELSLRRDEQVAAGSGDHYRLDASPQEVGGRFSRGGPIDDLDAGERLRLEGVAPDHVDVLEQLFAELVGWPGIEDDSRASGAPEAHGGSDALERHLALEKDHPRLRQAVRGTYAADVQLLCAHRPPPRSRMPLQR